MGQRAAAVAAPQVAQWLHCPALPSHSGMVALGCRLLEGIRVQEKDPSYSRGLGHRWDLGSWLQVALAGVVHGGSGRLLLFKVAS